MNLEQTCTKCGLTEAAGSYCTRCLQTTLASDKHPAERSSGQRDAIAKAQAVRLKETGQGA